MVELDDWTVTSLEKKLEVLKRIEGLARNARERLFNMEHQLRLEV
jgi:hypothetical protein